MTPGPLPNYRRDLVAFVTARLGEADTATIENLLAAMHRERTPKPPPRPQQLDDEGMALRDQLLAMWESADMFAEQSAFAQGQAEMMDMLMRAIAAGFADHADYDESWRPDAEVRRRIGPFRARPDDHDVDGETPADG